MHYSNLSTYELQINVQNAILDVLKKIERNLNSGSDLNFDLVPNSMRDASVTVRAFGESYEFSVKWDSSDEEPYFVLNDVNTYSCNKTRRYDVDEASPAARVISEHLNAGDNPVRSAINDIESIVSDLGDLDAYDDRDDVYEAVNEAIRSLERVRGRVRRTRC